MDGRTDGRGRIDTIAWSRESKLTADIVATVNYVILTPWVEVMLSVNTCFLVTGEESVYD